MYNHQILIHWQELSRLEFNVSLENLLHDNAYGAATRPAPQRGRRRNAAGAATRPALQRGARAISVIMQQVFERNIEFKA